MKTEEEIFNELKALLANYPEQRVDLEEVHRYTILAGEYQEYNEGIEDEDWDELTPEELYEEDHYEQYVVDSMYINENDELSFDLTMTSWDWGNVSDCEELKNVTIDILYSLLDKPGCELDFDMDELERFIEFLK